MNVTEYIIIYEEKSHISNITSSTKNHQNIRDNNLVQLFYIKYKTWP